MNAAQALAKVLPENWRVVVIDRNSHLNHIFVFNRYSVISGHEPKAFVPYKRLFWPEDQGIRQPPKVVGPHKVLQATVTGINAHSLTLSRAIPDEGISEPKISFDYLVYALGSHLPEPIDLWGSISLASVPHDGTKAQGIEFLKRARNQIKEAPSILVVGGGALGIQYTTDIAEAFPDKPVTLLHSRKQLLPRFDVKMHDQVVERMSELSVNLLLGERLDLSSVSASALNTNEEHVLRTTSGREIRAGLVLLCTGQKPNTELLRKFAPDAIVADGPNKGFIRVNRSLQIAVPSTTGPDEVRIPYPHIFAIGDAADAFGANKAARYANEQARLAANNIAKLIKGQEGQASETEPLDQYTPGPPGIKISVGLHNAIYQRGANVGAMADQPEDWGAPAMWKRLGYTDLQETDINE